MIQDDDHLLVVLRYVEANPLRAGMVIDLKDYPWTSDPAHGLGRADPLVSAAPPWSGLGATEEARRAYWQRLVHEPLTAGELGRVRAVVTSGRPFGSPAWVAATAQALGLKLAPRPRGRPRK